MPNLDKSFHPTNQNIYLFVFRVNMPQNYVGIELYFTITIELHTSPRFISIQPMQVTAASLNIGLEV